MLSQQAGKRAENSALDYLSAQRLQLVERNYNCKLGEIDLIMRDGDYLVFIEVRSRVNERFGGGVGSITMAKRRKIMNASSHYLMMRKMQDKFPLRFDVISIDGTSGVISWLRDAFGVDY